MAVEIAEESILKSTKKSCNVPDDYTVFDMDFVLYINGVLSTLAQLGIGPVNGFQIEDDSAKWGDLLGSDKNLNNVKTYTVLRVRMLFDPPSTSFAIAAMEKQIQELEWRLNVHREATQWADPVRPTDPEYDPFADEIITPTPVPIVLDGGDSTPG